MNNHIEEAQEKEEDSTDKVPVELKNAVLLQSEPLPANTPTVKGFNMCFHHRAITDYKLV